MDKSADSKEHPKYFTPDPSYRVHSWMGDYLDRQRISSSDPENVLGHHIAKNFTCRLVPYDKGLRVEQNPVRENGSVKTARPTSPTTASTWHVLGERRNKVALIWKGRKARMKNGSLPTQLLREVQRFANA